MLKVRYRFPSPNCQSNDITCPAPPFNGAVEPEDPAVANGHVECVAGFLLDGVFKVDGLLIDDPVVRLDLLRVEIVELRKLPCTADNAAPAEVIPGSRVQFAPNDLLIRFLVAGDKHPSDAELVTFPHVEDKIKTVLPHPDLFGLHLEGQVPIIQVQGTDIRLLFTPIQVLFKFLPIENIPLLKPESKVEDF